jgi:hypothetical protein
MTHRKEKRSKRDKRIKKIEEIRNIKKKRVPLKNQNIVETKIYPVDSIFEERIDEYYKNLLYKIVQYQRR